MKRAMKATYNYAQHRSRKYHSNNSSTIFCLFWVVNLSKQNSQITPKLDFYFFVNIWWVGISKHFHQVLKINTSPYCFTLLCVICEMFVTFFSRFNRKLLAFSLHYNWIASFMWPCANSIISSVFRKFTHVTLQTKLATIFLINTKWLLTQHKFTKNYHWWQI